VLPCNLYTDTDQQSCPFNQKCMTPEEYRAKWNLPADYPMVAPAYAAQRSQFAKAIGLGRSRPEPEPEATPAKRSRRRAAA
jgi:predicted transcriptional regulator